MTRNPRHNWSATGHSGSRRSCKRERAEIILSWHGTSHHASSSSSAAAVAAAWRWRIDAAAWCTATLDLYRLTDCCAVLVSFLFPRRHWVGAGLKRHVDCIDLSVSIRWASRSRSFSLRQRQQRWPCDVRGLWRLLLTSAADFGHRSLSVAGPSAWNSFSSELKNTSVNWTDWCVGLTTDSRHRANLIAPQYPAGFGP